MRVAGSGEGTHWHECTKCGQPCDPAATPYENQLRDWRRELETNEFGMAHLAPRAIALIERDINWYRKHQEATKDGNFGEYQ